MLARFGPVALPGVFVFLIPAPALAVDHKDPNASPPEDLDVAGLLLVNEAVEVREGLLLA